MGGMGVRSHQPGTSGLRTRKTGKLRTQAVSSHGATIKGDICGPRSILTTGASQAGCDVGRRRLDGSSLSERAPHGQSHIVDTHSGLVKTAVVGFGHGFWQWWHL